MCKFLPAFAQPQLVAESFIKTYYLILERSPDQMFRFYKEESSMTIDHGEPVNGGESTQAIQSAIMASIAGAHVTLPIVLNAQLSISRSLLLLVSGILELKGEERAFTQTFLLAAQTTGYYIYNDIIRIAPSRLASAPAPASSSSEHPAAMVSAPQAVAVAVEQPAVYQQVRNRGTALVEDTWYSLPRA
ncbi:MAG: hypothetical protein WDW38_002456 [Sanguina aurantia]